MEICRVCLKTSETLVNFTSNDTDQFLRVTGIRIKSPHDEFLCEKCSERLVTAFEFIEDALTSDRKLQEYNLNEKNVLENDNGVEEIENTDRPDEISVNEEEKAHEKTIKTFVCVYEGCNKEFGGKRYLKRHIKNCHLEIETFICELCARRCASRAILEAHRRTHTGERPFKCKEPNCTSAFRRPSDLYYHKSSHSNERPYICADCGASYKLKFGLRNHMRQVHKIGGKMLQCPYCDKEFLFKSKLESHQVKIKNI